MQWYRFAQLGLLSTLAMVSIGCGGDEEAQVPEGTLVVSVPAQAAVHSAIIISGRHDCDGDCTLASNAVSFKVKSSPAGILKIRESDKNAALVDVLKPGQAKVEVEMAWAVDGKTYTKQQSYTLDARAVDAPKVKVKCDAATAAYEGELAPRSDYDQPVDVVVVAGATRHGVSFAFDGIAMFAPLLTIRPAADAKGQVFVDPKWTVWNDEEAWYFNRVEFSASKDAEGVFEFLAGETVVGVVEVVAPEDMVPVLMGPKQMSLAEKDKWPTYRVMLAQKSQQRYICSDHQPWMEEATLKSNTPEVCTVRDGQIGPINYDATGYPGPNNSFSPTPYGEVFLEQQSEGECELTLTWKNPRVGTITTQKYQLSVVQ